MRGETRRLVEASWRAAKRCADAEGALIGKSPSVAGQYLECAHGDAALALRLVPTGNAFWARVHSHLSDILVEEPPPEPSQWEGVVDEISR